MIESMSLRAAAASSVTSVLIPEEAAPRFLDDAAPS
jgi:hypothetical protein